MRATTSAHRDRPLRVDQSQLACQSRLPEADAGSLDSRRRETDPRRRRNRPSAVIRRARASDCSRLTADGRLRRMSDSYRRNLPLGLARDVRPQYFGTCHPSPFVGGTGRHHAGHRSTAALCWRERVLPTHRSRRRFSQRTTGLPWNLTSPAPARKSLMATAVVRACRSTIATISGPNGCIRKSPTGADDPERKLCPSGWVSESRRWDIRAKREMPGRRWMFRTNDGQASRPRSVRRSPLTMARRSNCASRATRAC